MAAKQRSESQQIKEGYTYTCKMRPQLLRLFILLAACLLLLTGLAKIISAFGQATILNMTDPIFKISFRNLMGMAGILEVAISIFCLTPISKNLSVLLLLWLSICFAIYRYGLNLLGWETPCSCLGTLSGNLGIPPQTADSVLKLIVVYLFGGSLLALLLNTHQYNKK